MGNKYSERQGSRKNPYSSISPEDFAKMCNTVDRAFSQVNSAARQVKQQVATAQQSSYAAHQQAVAQANLVKSRFKSPVGLVVSGAIMAVIGCCAALLLTNFVVLAAVVELAAELSSTDDYIAFAIMGLVVAGFLALLVFGIRNLLTASSLRSFQRAFGAREAMLFTDLAASLHTSADQARKRANTLLKRGLIPEGHIDDEKTTLMVTQNAFQQYCALRKSQQALLEQRKADREARAADENARIEREHELLKRLSPAERAFLEEGRDYQVQLRKLDELIDDEVVSGRIVAIEDVLQRILARAEEDPRVIEGIGRLNSYYLPTTVKLLTSYDSLEEQPVQGENVSSSRREIEKTLEVLRVAFEKLLDDTYHEMSIDVSTDITVLQSILAREGLVEGPFDMNPTSAS